jgi:hypothetical protein
VILNKTQTKNQNQNQKTNNTSSQKFEMEESHLPHQRLPPSHVQQQQHQHQQPLLSDTRNENNNNNIEDENDFERISNNRVEIPKGAGFSFTKLFAFIGPAFFVSIGYLDPGNCRLFSFFFLLSFFFFLSSLFSLLSPLSPLLSLIL